MCDRGGFVFEATQVICFWSLRVDRLPIKESIISSWLVDHITGNTEYKYISIIFVEFWSGCLRSRIYIFNISRQISVIESFRMTYLSVKVHFYVFDKISHVTSKQVVNIWEKQKKLEMTTSWWQIHFNYLFVINSLLSTRKKHIFKTF